MKKLDSLQLSLATIKRQYRELRKKQPDIVKINVNHQFDFTSLSDQGIPWSTIKKAAKNLGIISQSKDGELIWIWPDGKEKRRHLRHKLREVIQVLHDYLKDKTQLALSPEELDCSQEILQEGLEALAIECVRVKDSTYWLLPARTVQEAIRTLNDQSLKKSDNNNARSFYKPKKLRESAAQIALRDIITEYKFDAPAVKILEDLEQFGYSRITAHRVKKKLKISSVKLADGWHWIYPSLVVQNWLDGWLLDRPIVVDIIYHAAEDKGWSRQVVDAARREFGGIKETYVKTKRCWYNMNNCSPPFTEIL